MLYDDRVESPGSKFADADLIGLPILPPYYSLRLLPYVVPQISTWKRRMLKEKDLTDALA